MGNEESSSPLQRKIPNTISEDEEQVDEKQNFRRSSVKMKSFHIDKEQYHGQAVGEIKDGYGICYYENGDKYDGNWKDNKKEGKGSYFYNEKGEVYKGNFCNDFPNGMGIYYFKNGDRYEGMFKDGKKHGEGTIIFSNGGKFKGEFKNDVKHGKGEYKNTLGQVKYEYWDNGILKSKNKEDNIIINENESINLFNETTTKKYNEFLKTTNRKKPIEKIPLLMVNKIKNIKEKTKNKIGDQQLVEILNSVKKKPNVKAWTVDDVKILFQKINLDKYIPNIEANSIDGKKLLFLDNQSISNLFKLTDKNETKIIGALIEFIEFTSNHEQEKHKIENNDENYTNNISNNNLAMNIYSNKNSNNIIINKVSNKEEELEKKKIIDKIQNNLDFNENKEKGKNKIKNKNKVKKKEGNYFSSDVSSSSSNQKNEDYIKEMNKLGNTEFYSSLNNNSLNFFINYNEIKKEKTIVGEGGMGEVSLGEWQGKKVALKKIKLKFRKKGNNYVLKKFINEINIIASMRHPNILLYMGTAIDNDNYYMITEYLPKGSLYEYLHNKKGFLTDSQKIKIAFQIAIAIQYIHSRKILHCDLKSSNVLLDEDFKIKLSDFGLSYFMSEAPEKTGEGTYHWMAPEILNEGKYKTTSDIFSYGMILWELLTGKTPYYNINNSIFTKDQLKDIVNEKYNNNEEIIPIPKNGNIVLRYIASRCLQYKPENRLSLDVILKHLSRANKCYEEIDEVTVELYNFVS